MASYLESLNALQAQYARDPHPLKANLMIGVYRDDSGKPHVLPSVKMVRGLIVLHAHPISAGRIGLTEVNQARQKLSENPDWNHEYPSSHLGEAAFRGPAASLFFGKNTRLVRDGR